ncbi:Gfo/Idh/MocA family oxidoreductase [candidate division KSB1 bacterium]|nr:Gfo/Idh/MocA family oxidoreductase [candidate division KSB1 bacterium]
MSQPLNRREFLELGALTAGALMMSCSAANDTKVKVPVFLDQAPDGPPLKAGLIGCGGRGTGAAEQIMRAGKDVRLVALGDLFRERLESSFQALGRAGGENFAVTKERCFVGIDAYKQVIDSGVDAVLLATPPHFRPAHVEAAVAAGKHVFVEKPVGVDAPGTLRVREACRVAARKGLSVVSGLMLHYDESMQRTIEQVHGGAIGRIVALECNYNVGGLWVIHRQPGWSDMEWQLRNWYYFTWLSGDHIVEQHVHLREAGEEEPRGRREAGAPIHQDDGRLPLGDALEETEERMA